MNTKSKARGGQQKKLKNDTVKEINTFQQPPECPVFTPTLEEFEDPLSYINKIKPKAENFGICRIIPPKTWLPTFSLNVDNFKFTPRLQRLNELEAKTRIKLNFLKKLDKFWELQGTPLQIPRVERRALDLYSLHRCVLSEGGAEVVTKKRRWTRIAISMGYAKTKGIASTLRLHHERLLFPYEVCIERRYPTVDTFTQTKVKEETLDVADTSDVVDTSDVKPKIECIDEEYNHHEIRTRRATAQPNRTSTRRSKRHSMAETSVNTKKVKPHVISDSVIKIEDSNELERLDLCGAGPKMVRPGNDRLKGHHLKRRRKKVKRKSSVDPLAKYICPVCHRGNAESVLLICDCCDVCYHTFCLFPPLSAVPKGAWRCPKCVAKEVNKPTEAFGFEDAQKEYTLELFSEMADQFKSDYFNLPVQCVPLETVEQEFWRLLSSINEEVTVEYGADLHTVDHGSGFPTMKSAPNIIRDKSFMDYVKSKWNLNNLPLLDGSVFGHIKEDISGMKVPWIYIGMCFAAFCWHNEDHWSYSINYLHWGEPKTWYGVPGAKAEEFENVMKAEAPELFDAQPDLLHQLVTIINPNTLMRAGVPVYRTDQIRGEFVVTFPRSYHAGFNQGYNFAEAVNFATCDWIKTGRECITHYSNLHRFPVFSHDELICNMALHHEMLDAKLATAILRDWMNMINHEEKYRKLIWDSGTTTSVREIFELLPDDSRQCEHCNTTIFLAAVTCPCKPRMMVCIRHHAELCRCDPSKHILKFRYSLKELPSLVQNLVIKTQAYKSWASNVRNALQVSENPPPKSSLKELKELLAEAESKGYPNLELLDDLNRSIKSGNQYSTIAQQLEENRNKPRTKETTLRSTVDDVALFYGYMKSLPCKLEEEESVRNFVESAKQLKADIYQALKNKDTTSQKLEELVEAVISTGLTFEELPGLEEMLGRVKWLEELSELLLEPNSLTAEWLKEHLNRGNELLPHFVVMNARAVIEHLLNDIDQWEKNAKACFLARARQPISYLEDLLKTADTIKAVLPSKANVIETLHKAKEWIAKVNDCLESPICPYIDVYEDHVAKGKGILVNLEMLPRMESQLSVVKIWRDKASKIFLKKNSPYSLLEVLSPRSETGVHSFKSRKRNNLSSPNPVIFDTKLSGNTKPPAVVAAFRKAEKFEFEILYHLRVQNVDKRQFKSEAKYCLCRKAASGFMMECSLCLERFHASCVPMGRVSCKQNRSEIMDTKFLCPICIRSRRPNLDTLITLLVGMNAIPIRIPEGEALQCLTERAMNWQDRVRQLLTTPEMIYAMSKVVIQRHQAVEVAARQKTEKIVSAELKKSTIKQEVHSSIASTSSSGGYSQDLVNMQMMPPAPLAPSEKTETKTCYNSSEHAYSAVSKKSPPPKKHMRKSPLVPRELGGDTVIRVSDAGYEQLKTLMFQGDLMEVSLEETHYLWRLLHALKKSRPNESDETDQEIEDDVGEQIPDTKALASSSQSRRPAKAKAKAKEGAKEVSRALKRTKEPVVKRTLKRAKEMLNKSSKGKKKNGSRRNVAKNIKDEEDECAAGPCLHPTGCEVHWVQCDGGCELWFHLDCVGLGKTDVAEDEDYICKKCSASYLVKLEEKNPSLLSGIEMDQDQVDDPYYSNPGQPVIAACEEV